MAFIAVFFFFFSQRGLGKKITEGPESGVMKRGPALVGKGLIPKPLWFDDFLCCYRTNKAGRNPHRAEEVSRYDDTLVTSPSVRYLL